MTERIVPATAALAERERKAIEDMKALFPDGNVSGLDYVDKALGKRLSKLYRVLGYETRGEMIEAFGFRQEGGKGGRPTELDPEAIFAELQDRYDGMPKPKAYGLLVNENPDLKGKLKTLSNKSNELFGRSLTKELIARGLLDRAPVEEKPEMSDDEILEGLKRLEEKYADSTDRVKTLTALKSKDPDAKPLIEALDSKRSRELLGTTAADYFKSHGILEGGARFTDTSDIEEAINALAELSKDIPDDDKPKTIADVCARYPDYSALIKAGQQKKVLTKNTLMERGIIGLTQAAKKAKEKLARERCVRNAEVPDLLRMYCGSGGDTLALPVRRHDFLRPGVIGLDVRSGYELRETTLIAPDVSGVNLGDKLNVSYVSTGDYSMPFGIVITKDDSRIAEVPRPENDAFVARQPFEVDTDLNDYIECTVKGIDQADNRNIVRIRHRFLHPITAETMVYALRGIGAISDEELLGGDSWRDRLDTMPESVDFTDAGKRIAESANAGPMLDDNHGSAKNLSTGNEASKQDGQVEHVPYVLSEKTPPTIKIVDDALEGVSAPESIEGKMTENGAPFITFGINAKENGSSTNADDEGSASTGFSFGISRKSEPTEASNGAQAEYEAEERARQEAEEKARREAEEAARSAEEQARREAAERAEREKREVEERAERERREVEEKARREAEEAARLAEEQARKEAAEKAEREKREVETKRSSLQADIDKLNASLAEMRRERDVYAARKKEIERLEATVKALNAEIAKLGIFKNKEKKAKREELAQAMAEIASLKERNVGASSKDHEIAAAEKRLSEITEELKALPEL